MSDRESNGHFKVGNKMGVNMGRPKGSGAKQRLFMELVAPKAPGLIKVALSLAEEGDPAMLKMFLDRVLPTKVHLENLEINSLTIQQSIKNLISYVETGDISPDDASKIASILHKDAEIANQESLLEKLKMLEGKVEADGKVNISFNKGRVIENESDSNNQEGNTDVE